MDAGGRGRQGVRGKIIGLNARDMAKVMLGTYDPGPGNFTFQLVNRGDDGGNPTA